MGQREKTGTAVGAGSGAVIGGLIGNEVGGDRGTIIGALIGGLIGGVIGNKIGESFDRRDKEINNIARESNISVSTNTYSLLNDSEKSKHEKSASKLSENKRVKALQEKAVYTTVVPSQFASGSALLTSSTEKMFDKMAKAFKKDGIRKVMIVGHADNSGSSSVNQKLSELRAKAVAGVFVRNGYPRSLVYYQGAGESQPLMSNATARGRAKNRRVEIIDAAKVSGLAMAKNFSLQKSRKTLIIEKKRSIEAQRKINKSELKKSSEEYSGATCMLPFKGEPYEGKLLLSSGRLAIRENGRWSFGTLFGSEARAASIGSIPSFMEDNAIESGRVKRMDGKSVDIYSVSDYLPGYYKQPVYAFVSNGFFSLYPVSLIRNSLSPVNKAPEMSIYKRYDAMSRAGKKDYVAKGDSWVYVNGNQILYRWKSGKAALAKTGIIGIDVLMERFDESDFAEDTVREFNAQVYYINNKKVYAVSVPVSLKLSKRNNIKWRL